MKTRRHPLRRKRYVIQRVDEGGSLLAWNDTIKGWLEVNPATYESLDIYSPYRATIFEGNRPDAYATTGYVTARAVEVSRG
jgi:hypothetical protein